MLDTLQTIKRENHRLIADNPVTSLRRLEINKLNPSEKDAPQEINNNQVDSNTSLDYMELQALLELQSHGLTAKDLQAFKRLIFTQNHKLALTYLICHDRLKPMAAIDILNTASPNEIQELAEKHLQTQIENNQQPNDSNSNNNNLGGLSSAVNSMDMDFVPELNTNSTSPGSDQPISLLDLETALESLLNLPGHPAIEEPDEDISTVESDTVSLSDLVIEEPFPSK
ncbi:MAG: hypothetical protein HWD59_03295 [Coxiellaceae bacterium]|nr:MAG: hypothetical protein HWD59_03295 [Coxiellaceae bacterium]